jgi:hypothetical protein
MMGFYALPTTVEGPVPLLLDVYLVASDGPSAPPMPAKVPDRDQYTLVGYWDAGNNGSHGSDDSTGAYMMAMYAKYARQ